MIDMSVHHMAALRMVAQAAGAGTPMTVKAHTHNSGSGLAPPDGAEATVTWESGLVSSVALCMVAASVCARPMPRAMRRAGDSCQCMTPMMMCAHGTRLLGDPCRGALLHRVRGVRGMLV